MKASPRLKAKLHGRSQSRTIRQEIQAGEVIVKTVLPELIRRWDGDGMPDMTASGSPAAPALTDPTQQFFSAEGFEERRRLLLGQECLYRLLFHSDMKTSRIADYAELKKIGSGKTAQMVTMQNGDVVALDSVMFLAGGSLPVTTPSAAVRSGCSA